MASVTFNDAEVEAFKGQLAGAYRNTTAPVILRMMRVECPVDTGVLKQQHKIDPGVRKVTGGYLIRFRAAPYWGVFVGLGHGIIRPKRAKMLRWVNKSGTVVFARKVRAVPGNPWMARTFVRAGLYDVKHGPIPPRV